MDLRDEEKWDPKVYDALKRKQPQDKFNRFGLDVYVRCVLYDDGVKIDFSIWPVEVIKRIIEQATLPAGLNIGYRVLFWKEIRI